MGKKDKAAAAATPAKEDAKEEIPYENKTKFCCVIAKPLADEKMCKRVLKLARKVSCWVGSELKGLMAVMRVSITHACHCHCMTARPPSERPSVAG